MSLRWRGTLLPAGGAPGPIHRPQSYSPLHRLPVREERSEARDALKGQGAEAPVVHGHCVLLLLQEFRGLHEDRRWGTPEPLPFPSSHPWRGQPALLIMSSHLPESLQR